MSEAIKVAATAADVVETLITDMLAGGHADNCLLLGTLQTGATSIQVQLHVMQNESLFLDECGCKLIEPAHPELLKQNREALEQLLIHKPEALLDAIQGLQAFIKGGGV